MKLSQLEIYGRRFSTLYRENVAIIKPTILQLVVVSFPLLAAASLERDCKGGSTVIAEGVCAW